MLAYEQTGSGIPLVFVHAFPLSRLMWGEEKSAFSQNFRVIAVDLPGFGESPPLGNVSSMEGMADELLSCLDQTGGGRKAVFVGVSMGGYVLFQLLKRAPERVRALVLVSTRPRADPDEIRLHRLKMIEAVQNEGPSFLSGQMVPQLLGQSTQRSQIKRVKQVRRWVEGASKAGVMAALRGMAERPDATPFLKTISVPTLVLSGAEDTLISSQEMKEMARQIPAAEFSVIEKAGHLLNVEQPALFVEHLIPFLKRRVLAG